MEDTRSVAGWAGGQELLHNEVKTVDEIVNEVDAVTTADVKRVARNLFQTERLALSIVGPHRSDKRFVPLLKI
jgi:predicted Zn-dependent peptidase